jgi:hypothetical protein
MQTRILSVFLMLALSAVVPPQVASFGRTPRSEDHNR